MTEMRLRSPPWYSQKASHALSRTISRSTPSPSGSGATPARPRARLLYQRGDDLPDPVGRHGDRAPPALVSLRQRPVAGQKPIELSVRRLEDRLVRVRRPQAVAALDLVGVRAGRAGHERRAGVEPAHLVVQPSVVQLAEEFLGVRRERARLPQRLGVHGAGEFWRARVRVHDPVTCRPSRSPSFR